MPTYLPGDPAGFASGDTAIREAFAERAILFSYGKQSHLRV